MEHQDRSKADEWALETDGKYSFDHPVLRDVRFGVRLTDRERDPEHQPELQLGGDHPAMAGRAEMPTGEALAYLGDPRFSATTQVHNFTNFFNNGTNVPSLVFPNVSLAHRLSGQLRRAAQLTTTSCARKSAIHCTHVEAGHLRHRSLPAPTSRRKRPAPSTPSCASASTTGASRSTATSACAT
jgi:hypothetical protein